VRKPVQIFFLLGILLALSACQTKPWQQLSRCDGQTSPKGPFLIEIDGRPACVDQVVSRQLCGSYLSGVAYVVSDITVEEWEEVPNFLANCEFEVEPGSIVLVGDHNDTPYYNGCSCHQEIE
jgi:hypothetical protein